MRLLMYLVPLTVFWFGLTQLLIPWVRETEYFPTFRKIPFKRFLQKYFSIEF